jgi:hypothetical protein
MQSMKKVIEFPPGDIDLSEQTVLDSNTVVRGQGIGVTVLHNRIPELKQGSLFTTEIAPVYDITFENFSVDNHGHRLCITTNGSGHLAEYVEVYNHSSMSSEDLESFAILFDNHESLPPASDCTMRYCFVRSFHDGYDGGLVIAGKGGQKHGVIDTCYFFGSGVPYAPRDMEGVMGANLVTNCSFYNCALGIYTEGGLDEMIVHNCFFENIRGTAARINLEVPQRLFEFRGNVVELAGGTGVHIYGMPNHLETLLVEGNRFEGNGRWLDVCDTSLHLHNNRFDVNLSQMVQRCNNINLSNNLDLTGRYETIRRAKPHSSQSQLKTRDTLAT